MGYFSMIIVALYKYAAIFIYGEFTELEIGTFWCNQNLIYNHKKKECRLLQFCKFTVFSLSQHKCKYSWI